MKTIQFTSLTAMVFCCSLTASAQTWTQTSAPATNWISVASSADGVNLVAAVGGLPGAYNVYGSVYTSTNSGATWLEQTNAPTMNWQTVASSADGSRLLAVAGSKSSSVANGSGIFTSVDGGFTWKSNDVRQSFYQGGIMSKDGTNLIVVRPFTFSTNAGDTWSTNASPLVTAIAASADGTKIVGGGISGPLYLTKDFGNTWTNALSSGGWPSFASSVDGNTLVAYGIGTPPPGGLFISTNGGSSWGTNSFLTSPCVASSADGKKLTVALRNGGIYTSTNSGGTWIQTSAPNQHWQSISSSADGNVLVAAVYGGGIWTSRNPAAPQLSITTSSTEVGLSWIIPSTNLVLQQSADLSNWADATNVPALNLTNLQNQVTLPLNISNSFYRLKTP